MDTSRSTGSGIGSLGSHLQELLKTPVVLVPDAGELSRDGGAYLLVVDLAASVSLAGKFSGQTLGPGRYVYAGSARGSGGIRARVSRHMRLDKRQRWHIDQITTGAAAIWAAEFMELGECDLIGILSGAASFSAALPGFGSTDCATCPAHLLRYEPATNLLARTRNRIR